MKTRNFFNTGGLTMLRHSLYWFGMPCLTLVATLALAGTASAQEFAAMAAKGEVSVNDPSDPSMLRFDLKSSFSLGPNSKGINPLADDLTLNLTYAGSISPELSVFVPAGCFTQAGSSFKAVPDYSNCGIQLLQGKLLPAINKFDLRLTPGRNGQWDWDLKVSIDFFPSTPNGSTPNGSIAGIIAILRSPEKIGLSVGDDAGEVTIGKIVGKIAFSGCSNPQVCFVNFGD